MQGAQLVLDGQVALANRFQQGRGMCEKKRSKSGKLNDNYCVGREKYYSSLENDPVLFRGCMGWCLNLEPLISERCLR